MSSARSTKVLILTIGNGINVLINFLTLPYLVRTLSYLNYGSYGQVLMILGLIQGVFTFNLNQVANIYFSDRNYESKEVFSTLFRITILLSVLGSVFMIVSIPIVELVFSNDLIPRLLLLSLLNLFSQIPIPILISVLIYFGRVKHTAAILIFSNIFKVAVMFCSIKFFDSIELMMIGLSIASLIQVILLFYSVPTEVRKLNFYSKPLAGKFFKMATPLAVSSLIEKSLFYIDGIMISAMLGTTAYAFYRAGAIEVPFIATLYGAVSTIVMPEVAKYFADKNYKEIVRLKSSAISTTVFFVYPVLIYLLFFSYPLVSFYLSEKYINSVLVFSIFNLSLLIRINDYQDVLIVSGNSRFIFKSVVFTTILNLILNYVLIKMFGVEGSALAFIICLVIFAGLLTWKSIRIMNCKFTDLFNIQLIAKTSVVSVSLVLIVYALHIYFFKGVWFIIFVAPVYALIVFIAGVKMNLLHPALLENLKLRLGKIMKLLKWA
jgi:O-antigen/teichoic acid export membrane protein